eukprot:tig00001029_g6443.t1
MDAPLLSSTDANLGGVSMRGGPNLGGISMRSRAVTQRRSIVPEDENDINAAGKSRRLVQQEQIEQMQQESKEEVDVDDVVQMKKASLWQRVRALFRINKLVFRPYMSVESGGSTWEAGFQYTTKTYRSRPVALWLGLLLWVGVTYFGVLLPFGSQSEVGKWNHIERWWAVLAKPRWVLPTSWFIPCYLVMHFAAALGMWLLWQDGGVFRSLLPTVLYLVQIAFGALWADVFFGAKSLGGALAVVVFAWLTVSYMLYEFGRRNRAAALCLLVHWTMLTYGMALSSALNTLNPAGSVRY